jgi:hypothetical protein
MRDRSFWKDGDADGSDLATFFEDFGRMNCCEQGVDICEGDFIKDCEQILQTFLFLQRVLET